MNKTLFIFLLIISISVFGNIFKDAEYKRASGDYKGAENVLKHTFKDEKSPNLKCMAAYKLIQIYLETGNISDIILFSKYLLENGDMFQKKFGVENLYRAYLAQNKLNLAEKYLKKGLLISPQFKLYAYYFYRDRGDANAIDYLEDYYLISRDNSIVEKLIDDYEKSNIIKNKRAFWEKRRLNYKKFYISLLIRSFKNEAFVFIKELIDKKMLDIGLCNYYFNKLIEHKRIELFTQSINGLKDFYPLQTIFWRFKGELYFYGSVKAIEDIKKAISDKTKSDQKIIFIRISELLADATEYKKAFKLLCSMSSADEMIDKKIAYIAESRDTNEFFLYINKKSAIIFYNSIDKYFNILNKKDLLKKKDKIYNRIKLLPLPKKIHICFLFNDLEKIYDLLDDVKQIDAETEQILDDKLNIIDKEKVYGKYEKLMSIALKKDWLKEFEQYYFNKKHLNKCKKYLLLLKKLSDDNEIDKRLLFIKMATLGLSNCDTNEVVEEYPKIFYFYKKEYDKSQSTKGKNKNIDEIIEISSEVIEGISKEIKIISDHLNEDGNGVLINKLYLFLLHEKLGKYKDKIKRIRAFTFGLLGLKFDYERLRELIKKFEYGDMLINRIKLSKNSDLSEEDRYFLYYLNLDNINKIEMQRSIEITDNYFLKLLFKSKK